MILEELKDRSYDLKCKSCSELNIICTNGFSDNDWRHFQYLCTSKESNRVSVKPCPHCKKSTVQEIVAFD